MEDCLNRVLVKYSNVGLQHSSVATKVEEEVGRNPGITFSELKKSLNMANGQLQYHLRNADLIKKDSGYVKKEVCKECKLKGLCSSKCILGVLRDEKKVRILEMLDEGRPKKEIAEEIGIDPSTLSYHINILKEEDILEDGKVKPAIKEVL